MSEVHLILALHNHQPVGNFDHVFEQAYQDSYRLFLDVFERYPTLKVGLHMSGSLLEWLDAHHGDYLDRVAGLVAGRAAHAQSRDRSAEENRTAEERAPQLHVASSAYGWIEAFRRRVRQRMRQPWSRLRPHLLPQHWRGWRGSLTGTCGWE